MSLLLVQSEETQEINGITQAESNPRYEATVQQK